MFLRRRICVLLLTWLAITAQAQPAPVPADVSTGNLATVFVVCTGGIPQGECAFHSARIRRMLRDLRLDVELAGGWRYVVVDERAWPNTLKQFAVPRNVPAFSAAEVRTTYLHAGLLANDSRVDEVLAGYAAREVRLEWVLAHEAGHVLCHTQSERLADNAAARLRFGNSPPSGCSGRQ